MKSKSIEFILNSDKETKMNSKIINSKKPKLNYSEIRNTSCSETSNSFCKHIKKKGRKYQDLLHSFNPLENSLGITKANFFLRPKALRSTAYDLHYLSKKNA